MVIKSSCPFWLTTFGRQENVITLILFFFIGFVTSKVACCGQGPYNGMGLCTVLSNLCPNRELYVFWDAFHPTEKANRMIVRHILTGTTKYMNPMNLSSALALWATHPIIWSGKLVSFILIYVYLIRKMYVLCNDYRVQEHEITQVWF